jgi:hypothetical protein
MYSRYYQNSGFFEPQYEQPFTYAHERKAYEEGRSPAGQSGGSVPPKSRSQHDSEREKRHEREQEREKERSERRERERERRERERRRESRRRGSIFSNSGKGSGLLSDLDLDSGDIILLALLWYLYQETGDLDMLIILAAIFLFDK